MLVVDNRQITVLKSESRVKILQSHTEEGFDIIEIYISIVSIRHYAVNFDRKRSVDLEFLTSLDSLKSIGKESQKKSSHDRITFSRHSDKGRTFLNSPIVFYNFTIASSFRLSCPFPRLTFV